MRKVIARGYFKKKVWEPLDEDGNEQFIDVPEGFSAKWLEGAEKVEAPKRRRKKVEVDPEVTQETEASDDDAS